MFRAYSYGKNVKVLRALISFPIEKETFIGPFFKLSSGNKNQR